MTAVRDERHFTVLDPRTFDGDAYQVAERAIQQMSGILALALETLEPTKLMLRNADLERALAAGIPLDEVAPSWPESPQGRKLAQLEEELLTMQRTLGTLARAAAYNPRAR